MSGQTAPMAARAAQESVKLHLDSDEPREFAAPRRFPVLQILKTRAWGKHKRLFLWSVINSVLNKIWDLAPPVVVGWIIDTVSRKPPSWIESFVDSRDTWQTAGFLCGLVVVIHVLESLHEYMFLVGFLSLSQQVQHNLRLDVFTHIVHREMNFFEGHRLGDTLSRLNDDVNTVERFLNTGFNAFLQLFIMLLFNVVVLFTVSWQLALVGLGPMIPIALSSLWYHRRVEPRYKAVRKTLGELTARLENSISGILVVKSFTAEKLEVEKVASISKEFAEANIHAVKVTASYTPLIRVGVAIGFAATVLIGSRWILEDGVDLGDGGQKQQRLSLGDFVLFCMLTQRTLWPLTRLGQVLDDYERSSTAAQRTLQLLDTPSSIIAPPGRRLATLPPVGGASKQEEEGKENGRVGGAAGGSVSKGEQGQTKAAVVATKGRQLTLDSVEFQYPATRTLIVKGLHLNVPAGQFLGIVGSTGSGKSTLVKLLLRLYDVSSGCIKLDGVDIRRLSLEELRRNVALVSQDVYLFHGTVLENVTYGSTATLAQAQEACRVAQLHSFIASLPGGYRTAVGERGVKLSGGQRQRLSIARALLKNSPVMILDEATSSVDTETERAIQVNLDTFIKHRTALVVAHRLSTIRNADKIAVFDQGRIVEVGTHEELVAKADGVYASLWAVQSGLAAK